jgi:hypothetical protein
VFYRNTYYGDIDNGSAKATAKKTVTQEHDIQSRLR